MRETSACVYCGCVIANPGCVKTVVAEDLLKKPWCEDAVGRCFKNILTHAVLHCKWEEAEAEERDGDGGDGGDGGDDSVCTVSACTNCFNCMTRRMQRGVYVLPVQELKWRIQTLEKITQKSMDSRVLLRVAAALSAKHEDVVENYYVSTGLLTATERRLLSEIASCAHMSDIDHMLAAHIVRQNGDSPFMTNSKTVEFIRQHYKSSRAHEQKVEAVEAPEAPEALELPEAV